MLGDCVLADKWLSQWSKNIRFDFQLFNYCERIVEWVSCACTITFIPRCLGVWRGWGECVFVCWWFIGFKVVFLFYFFASVRLKLWWYLSKGI
jgi:hypothetical protein